MFCIEEATDGYSTHTRLLHHSSMGFGRLVTLPPVGAVDGPRSNLFNVLFPLFLKWYPSNGPRHI